MTRPRLETGVVFFVDALSRWDFSIVFADGSALTGHLPMPAEGEDYDADDFAAGLAKVSELSGDDPSLWRMSGEVWLWSRGGE